MNTDFYISVMGHVFHIYPINSVMKKMLNEFITEPANDSIEIHVTAKMIEKERNLAQQVVSFEELAYETTAIHRAITEILVKENIFLFHGSALMKDGSAYIFTGISGAGKSTHSKLWRTLFKDEVTMINDDKPYLRFENNQIMVYGSPWNGKHHLGSNISAPLKAIGLIHQADINECIQVPKKDAYLPLFQQTYRPEDAVDLMKTMEFIRTMVDLVNVYDIYCTKDIEAAKISYAVMNGN